MEQEYPPALITTGGDPTLIGGPWSTSSIATWSKTLSGYSYGNGGYIITAAPGYELDGKMAHPQYLVFDSATQEPGAHWKEGNYLNGVWNAGTIPYYTADGSYYGDWVHIRLPDPIYLTKCSFTARAGNPNRVPSKFRIYGSNDGSTWTVIHDQTSPLTYTSNKGTVTVSNTLAWWYMGVVVSATPAGPTASVLNFLKFSIFGKVRAHVCIILFGKGLGKIVSACVSSPHHMKPSPWLFRVQNARIYTRLLYCQIYTFIYTPPKYEGRVLDAHKACMLTNHAHIHAGSSAREPPSTDLHRRFAHFDQFMECHVHTYLDQDPLRAAVLEWCIQDRSFWGLLQ